MREGCISVYTLLSEAHVLLFKTQLRLLGGKILACRVQLQKLKKKTFLKIVIYAKILENNPNTARITDRAVLVTIITAATLRELKKN